MDLGVEEKKDDDENKLKELIEFLCDVFSLINKKVFFCFTQVHRDGP